MTISKIYGTALIKFLFSLTLFVSFKRYIMHKREEEERRRRKRRKFDGIRFYHGIAPICGTSFPPGGYRLWVGGVKVFVKNVIERRWYDK